VVTYGRAGQADDDETTRRPALAGEEKIAATLKTPALRQVLEEVRLGAASTRREVVARTGLSASVAARAIRELVDVGLLEYAERASSTGGRAARTFRLAQGRRLVLAIDIEAARISAGVTDLGGHMLAQVDSVLPRDYEPAEALAQLDVAFQRLCGELGIGPDHLAAVGCSLPGAIDVYDGDAIVACLPPQWVRFPLRDRLAERFGRPVWLQNDAKAMAIAELRVGGLRGSSSGLVVKLDSGVGAGITVGDNLHPGSQGWAGDIGHICIDDARDVLCRCGSRGCLEASVGADALVASATAAARRGESALLETGLEAHGELTIADIASCASRGDQAALLILQNASERVGKVLSMTVNVLNPDVIVLSGALPAATESFLSGIRRQIYQHSHPFATRHLAIEQSAFAEGAGVVGAAWLALDNYFKTLTP
jgi:predicted NBD/HSP70 family sugar kinase/ribosomal protein S25